MVNFVQNTTFLFQLKFLFCSRLYCGFLAYPVARVEVGILLVSIFIKIKLDMERSRIPLFYLHFIYTNFQSILCLLYPQDLYIIQYIYNSL